MASGSLYSTVSSPIMFCSAVVFPPWPFSTKMRLKPWRIADVTTQRITAYIVA